MNGHQLAPLLTKSSTASDAGGAGVALGEVRIRLAQ
jgi:hypothetical protein